MPVMIMASRHAEDALTVQAEYHKLYTKTAVHPRPLKFARTSYDLSIPDLLPDDTTTVKVGRSPSDATFLLPTTSLQATSDFFARALKPEWGNTVKRLVELPEVHPALFDHYARWLLSGAEIMIHEDDWNAEFSEYMKWRAEVDCNRESYNATEQSAPCPIIVWDFRMTTKAWFLGDFLQSRDFQNHCLGHLYHMHRRFDPRFNWERGGCSSQTEYWVDAGDDDENEFWGTVGYVDIDDVLITWDMTRHCAGKTPFLLEQHPLRRFYVDWLEKYWDAYTISDWDHKTQDDIVALIDRCPDLVYKCLRGCTSQTGKDYIVRDTEAYWV